MNSTFQLFFPLKAGVLLAASENQRNGTHAPEKLNDFPRYSKLLPKANMIRRK